MEQELILRRKADLLLKTGQMLIESLADSNRVERNLRRMAEYMGLHGKAFALHITYAVLTLHLRSENYAVTRIGNCTGHGLNMSRITEISHLTWGVVRNRYTLDQIEEELNRIASQKKLYKMPLLMLAGGLACAALCLIFGGDLAAAGIAAVSASTAMYLRHRLIHAGLNVYMSIILTACTATLISCAGTLLHLSNTPGYAIASAVLFLIPGAPLINSLDDMTDGYVVVGLTRAANAVLTIACIAGGMLLAMYCFSMDELSLSLTQGPRIPVLLIAGAIAATGFSVIFNVPRRVLLICAFNGAVAVLVRMLIQHGFDTGPVAATFGASLAVGILSLFERHLIHVPLHVISVPAVIIMIPGSMLFRAMMGFVKMNHETALAAKSLILAESVDLTITGVLIIMTLSLGIAIAALRAKWHDIRKWQSEMGKNYPME